MKKNYSRIPFETISNAVNGDIEAINKIKHHFYPYIVKHSLRYMIDEFGHRHMIIDETLFGRLETRLLTKILTFEID